MQLFSASDRLWEKKNEIVRELGAKCVVKNIDCAGFCNVVTSKKRSLLSHETDNFAFISDKLKNTSVLCIDHPTTCTSYRKALKYFRKENAIICHFERYTVFQISMLIYFYIIGTLKLCYICC